MKHMTFIYLARRADSFSKTIPRQNQRTGNTIRQGKSISPHTGHCATDQIIIA
ncbi:MAG: hypothetical protein Q7J09_06550 [Methanocalculus sp.]|uniref:hypothetical protein n=1 Tax=Methanocalculus sp. TaxID=2004547 RepID=UPI002716A7BD|nr:hypothetical protein [Methanocalculus sp.]MDO8841164.1 hypothetical protein [Methanocalculus sp.]MDO9539647.1 hypothetical protein [Methanocalculus sp.]